MGNEVKRGGWVGTFTGVLGGAAMALGKRGIGYLNLRRSAEGERQNWGPPETCRPCMRRQGGVLVKAHARGGRGGFGH